MAEAANSSVDRDRDVFVTSFDVRINYVHGQRSRAIRGDLWNVFLGRELIDHFEDFDDAVELARKVAMRSGRPAWRSADGVKFDPLA